MGFSKFLEEWRLIKDPNLTAWEHQFVSFNPKNIDKDGEFKKMIFRNSKKKLNLKITKKK